LILFSFSFFSFPGSGPPVIPPSPLPARPHPVGRPIGQPAPLAPFSLSLSLSSPASPACDPAPPSSGCCPHPTVVCHSRCPSTPDPLASPITTVPHPLSPSSGLKIADTIPVSPFPPHRLDHPTAASPLPSSPSTLEQLERWELPPHHGF
jgi:hypothetical protein